jgi:hypothetical protein
MVELYFRAPLAPHASPFGDSSSMDHRSTHLS